MTCQGSGEGSPGLALSPPASRAVCVAWCSRPKHLPLRTLKIQPTLKVGCLICWTWEMIPELPPRYTRALGALDF